MRIPQKIRDVILKNDPEITHVDLHDRGLSGDDMQELAELLLQNKFIISLDLHRNNISGEGMAHLAKCKHLRKIDLHQNDIDEEGIKFLFQIPDLNYLNLNRNYLDNDAAELILTRCGSDFYISVEGNSIDKELVQAIREKCKDYSSNNVLNKSKPVSVADNSSTQWGNQAVKSCREESLKYDKDKNGHVGKDDHEKPTPT